MKKAKCVLIVALAVVMLFTVFGCGNKPEQTGVLEEGYLPNIAGKITVCARNDVYSTASSQKAINNWTGEFMKKYGNVNVEVNFIDYGQYLPMISSKSMGDVFFLDDGSLYQFAVTNSALMQLDYYIEALKVDMSNLYSGIVELGRCNGKTYMAGMTCGQQSFTYNMSMLKELGILEEGQKIENDWTWEEFKEIASQVKQVGEDGITIERIGAAFPVAWSPYYSSFFRAFGGQWSDTENKRISIYEDKKVMDGLNELKVALDNRYIYPLEIEMGTNMNTELSGINPIPESGDVCFFFQTSYSMLSSRGAQYEAAGIEWDAAPYWLFGDKDTAAVASPCGTLGFGVYSYTKNKDTAAALVLFLYSEEGQFAIHSQEGGDVPVIKTLAEQDFWHLQDEIYEGKNFEAFVANSEKYCTSHVGATVPPEIADIINNGMKTLISNYLKGTASWDDGLKEIETKCNEKWSTLAI